eukprot:4561455-Prymnesium_polylepis.1
MRVAPLERLDLEVAKLLSVAARVGPLDLLEVLGDALHVVAHGLILLALGEQAEVFDAKLGGIRLAREDLWLDSRLDHELIEHR